MDMDCPVTAAAPVTRVQNDVAATDGYTDSVRGSLINILA